MVPAVKLVEGHHMIFFFKSGRKLFCRSLFFRFLILFEFCLFNSSMGAAPQFGRLVGWGSNYSNVDNIPSGLSNVTHITLGFDAEAPFGVALKADNTAVSWGRGQVDAGTWPDYGQAIVPSGLSNVVALSSGAYHCLALKGNGEVVSWGFIPEVPEGLNDVMAIAAGAIHNLALRSNGTVVAWGDNFGGQTSVPIGLSDVKHIAAGGNHSLALKNDGTVVGWGNSAYGQATIPPGLSNVVKVAAGQWYSLALHENGTISGWGDNRIGQASPPADLTNVVAIAAGRRHALALKSNGKVVAWGSSDGGANMPPSELGNVVAIAAGARESAGISIDLRTELLVTGFNPTIHFQTFYDQNYSVECSSSVSDTNWTPVPGGNVIGNGDIVSVMDTNALLVSPVKFYRVSLSP